MPAETDVTVSRLTPNEVADHDLALIFSAFTISATIWLLFATALGVLLALKFPYPDLATTPTLAFGRLRPIHTNATFYAWASPALIGLAFYIAARSSGTRLYNTRLAWICLVLINISAILGTVALDRRGNVDIREVPFQVRNGPGITLSGLHPGAVVRDTLHFTVNAFGAEDPFEPRRAESPSPIPVWLWVLSMVIAAWAIWYVAVQWKPPAEFLKTPTYAAPMSEKR